MNIHNINQNFQKLQTIENYLLYKTHLRYYNNKPSKSKTLKEISEKKKKLNQSAVDNLFINSLIMSEHIIGNQSKLLLRKRSMNLNAYYRIRKIINYSLDNPSKQLNRSATSGWNKRNRNKSTSSLMNHREDETQHCTNRTMRLCQNSITNIKIKETLLEKETKGRLSANITMIHHLKNFYAKEFKFSAQTMPKINLEDFENQTKLINQSYNDVYHKHIKVKTKFDRNVPIYPLAKSTKDANQLFDKKNKTKNQEELYDEINRSNIDFRRSIWIRTPHPQIMKKNYSFINKAQRHRSAKDEMKKYITRVTLSKSSCNTYFDDKKCHLKIDNKDRFNICQ